jgi:hypothetical protein
MFLIFFVMSKGKASVSFFRTKTTSEKGERREGRGERGGRRGESGEGRGERGEGRTQHLTKAKPDNPQLAGGSCGCHRSSL